MHTVGVTLEFLFWGFSLLGGEWNQLLDQLVFNLGVGEFLPHGQDKGNRPLLLQIIVLD